MAGTTHHGTMRPLSGAVDCKMIATSTAAAIGHRRSAVDAACGRDPSTMTVPPGRGEG